MPDDLEYIVVVFPLPPFSLTPTRLGSNCEAVNFIKGHFCILDFTSLFLSLMKAKTIRT